MTTENALATIKGLSTLLRPRYTRGLLLEDDDLTSAVEYTRNSVRLLFRSLFGCGVICGFTVDARRTCNGRKLEVTIDRGVALDCLGNPIEVPVLQTVTYDPECDALPDTVWVSVCYLERNCRPRDVSCSTDDDSHVVHTRSHDGFEIKLYKEQPQCACSCEPPAPTGGGKSAGNCCNKSSGTEVAANPTPVRGCYAAHEADECGCDCDCSCVVLAKIDVKQVADEKSPPVPEAIDPGVRRRIRPVLLGHPQPTLKLQQAVGAPVPPSADATDGPASPAAAS